MRAKPDARARAVELRQEGWSYAQILEVVDASPASLSMWLRDVPLTDAQRAELDRRQERGRSAGSIALRRRRQLREASIVSAARADVGVLTDRELFLVGVGLYWAEGSKAKPWDVSRGVTLINSDPAVVRLFLAWLRLLGIEDHRITLRVAIHERADVERAISFWASVTGVAEDRFLRTTLKRHNPRTVRRNTGEAYVGCLVVGVRRSTDLNRRIAGWWAGIAAASERPVATIGALFRDGVAVALGPLEP